MTDRPWMPFYVGDFIRDTQHLTTTQVGAYFHLIMHYWVHGGLPDDDHQLARIARMRVDTWRRWHKQTISAFFGPGWRHKRIDKELQRFAETREKRSRAGIIGNAKRWQVRSPGHRQPDKNITSFFSVPRSARKRPAEEEG